jgi:signal transduction histidine kinase
VAIAAVAAGAILLFAVPLGVALRLTYRDEDLLRLQRDTFAATRQIDVSLGHDPIELPPSRDTLGVYDDAGRLVAGRGPVPAPALVRSVVRSGTPQDRVSDGRLVAAVPLLSGERVTGALRAERSAAGASRDAHQAWLLLAALAAAVVAIAIGAALLLGRRLARPLERLAETARRLGHGDFSVRAARTSVPEVDAVAEALDATADRLDDLVSRERTFSADASHQLRTPLAALRIELEAMDLLGAGADTTAALNEVDRLEATIDTLLAVARDAPRGDGEADLTAVIDDLEPRWRARLAAKGRPLHTRITTTEQVKARASQAVVCQILEVLLENAEYHGGGVVTVSLREREGWLMLDVADEGPGFEGDPEHAFRRGSSRDGYGIGLALARSLAHAEGGRLFASAPGPGPVVTLTLRAAGDGS